MNQSTIDLVSANTTENRDQSYRDATLTKFEIAILSVIFVFIVLGNGAVIIALVAARVKIQRMYYFLLHLSIADLLTAFANVLPQLIWEITVNFYGNNFLCKFVKYIQLLGPYLSSYVLVVTAIDRYQAICFPLANCTWTERRAKIMISVAWLIALICCLPQIFIFSYVQIATTTFPNQTSSFKVLKDPVLEPEEYTKYYFECWGQFPELGEKIYVLWYAISVFFVPLIVLVFTYFNICKVIWINARLGRTKNKTKAANRKSASSGGSRALIFHSKLASSLSKHHQRTERNLDLEINSRQTGETSQQQQLLETKLSSDSKNSAATRSTAMRGVDQKNQSTNHQPSSTPPRIDDNTTADSERMADCCRAQNGQTSTSSMNNQINSQPQQQQHRQSSSNILQPMTNDKFTAQLKSSSSIFTSRTAAQSTKLSKAKIKTIKVTLVVIICYISCSLPFCSVQIWDHFYPNAQTSALWTGPLITITMLLPSLNSCFNPWIYLLLNRNLLYTLLKLLFGTKCIQSETKYPNETTNQRLSISVHKTTAMPNETTASTNNSPTTVTPVHLPNHLYHHNNSTSPTSVDNILRKNRLKTITSNQSVKSDQFKKEIKTSQSTSDQVDTNLETNLNTNLESTFDKNSNRTLDTSSDKEDKNRSFILESSSFTTAPSHNNKVRTIDTVASLNPLNKINVEKCTGMQIKNFHLPRVASETNSLTLTAHKDQKSYQSSSSAPDLIKSVK